MEKKIKILHILTDANVGGAGRQLLYLIAASDRTKYDFEIILPENAALTPEFEKLGVPVFEVAGLCASRSPKAVRAMVRVIKERNPDVVHTHASLSGQVAARRAGIRCRVMTKHCSDMPPFALRHFPLKTWCRIVFCGLGRCIATDVSAAASMRACGMPQKKISVVYNGCPRLERPDEETLSSLRKKLNIPEGRLCVGFFGRLEPEKAPEILLQAASLCRRFTPDLHFLFCGTGSLREELEELAVRYGIADNVTFAGFVPDVAPYMSICEITVSPSVAVETSSLSVCEAMSLGLVPVVTDVGGSRALIDDAGYCVAPGDPSAIYQALMELARDPDLRKVYSRRALKRYESRCTSQRMAAQTCAIYDEVAGKRSVC